MPGPSMYGKLILCPVPATNMGQAASRQHRATPSVLQFGQATYRPLYSEDGKMASKIICVYVCAFYQLDL